MKNKKGQIEQIQSLITPLIGIAIVLVVGFLIIAQARDQVETQEGVNDTCQNSSGGYPSAACNATQETANALQDIPGWLPIIVITVIGAILIGLVGVFRTGKF